MPILKLTQGSVFFVFLNHAKATCHYQNLVITTQCTTLYLAAIKGETGRRPTQQPQDQGRAEGSIGLYELEPAKTLLTRFLGSEARFANPNMRIRTNAQMQSQSPATDVGVCFGEWNVPAIVDGSPCIGATAAESYVSHGFYLAVTTRVLFTPQEDIITLTKPK